MDFIDLINKGLLGYQPIFFPNGVITGTGLQFFGNLRGAPSRPQGQSQFASASKENFNPRRFGNIYVPPHLRRKDGLDSDFYFTIDDDDLPQFVRDNLQLLSLYRHFVRGTLEALTAEGCAIGSMMEIGCNNGLFPIEFSASGIADCHGADIVDYADVAGLLAASRGAALSFHHMTDDSQRQWDALPRVDLAWSYAVLLHQANPLAHLTRLASLARKAIFVMTNVGTAAEWSSADDMGLKFRSANSYYAAPFPNCFDVTIISPALLKFSLQRLGFSRIVEISPPPVDSADEAARASYGHWLSRHAFYLGIRDEVADDAVLSDYTIESERSPYNGQDVCVRQGYHHNIFLRDRRYFIVPHGTWLKEAHECLPSYRCLTTASRAMESLPAELSPRPVTAEEWEDANIVRYRNRYYFVPDGVTPSDGEWDRLHSLDRREKWHALVALLPAKSFDDLDGIIVDLVADTVVVRSGDDHYGRRITLEIGSMITTGGPDTRENLVRTITVATLLNSINPGAPPSAILLPGINGAAIERTPDGVTHVLDAAGHVLSSHDTCEDAWATLLVKAPVS